MKIIKYNVYFIDCRYLKLAVAVLVGIVILVISPYYGISIIQLCVGSAYVYFNLRFYINTFRKYLHLINRYLLNLV